MKLSFSTLGCPEYTLDEIITCGVKYGFDGVELRHVEKSVRLWETRDLNPGALAGAKRKFHDAGLEVPVIGTGVSFAKPGETCQKAQAEDLKRWAEMARGLSCPYLRVFAGPIPEGQSREETVKLNIEGYNKALEFLAGSGVTLLFETHDNFSTSRDLLPLLRGLQGGFGVLWDALHPYRFGEGIEDTWNKLGPFIKHIHLKDSREFSEAGFDFALLGEGKVPVPGVLELLGAGSYGGYFSFEWERGWHPEIAECTVAFPHYIQYMRRYS